MRLEEQQGGRIQPFCGSGTSAVTAGVSEGKGPDCQEASNESKPDAERKGEANAAGDAAPAKRVKAKSAGSRRIPSFLRRVDLLFQGRH
jgi:hypothetical protein